MRGYLIDRVLPRFAWNNLLVSVIWFVTSLVFGAGGYIGEVLTVFGIALVFTVIDHFSGRISRD